MTLWKQFLRTAADRDVAGYFERAPDDGGEVGVAVAFDRAEELVTIDRKGGLADLGRATDRFLADPRSAVVGYVGFDAVGLFEPALDQNMDHSPFPLGELAFVRNARVGKVPRASPRSFSAGLVRRPTRDSLPAGPFGRSVRRLVEPVLAGLVSCWWHADLGPPLRG